MTFVINYNVIILSLDFESTENRITMSIQEAMGCCNRRITVTSQASNYSFRC